jgi:hypothetical protein
MGSAVRVKEPAGAHGKTQTAKDGASYGISCESQDGGLSKKSRGLGRRDSQRESSEATRKHQGTGFSPQVPVLYFQNTGLTP